MFSVRSKLNIWDLYVGIFFSQWNFPTLLIWLGILTLNFFSESLPFLSQGRPSMALVVFFLAALRLILVMVVVSFFFVVVGIVTGNLKNQLVEQEYTIEGTIITDRANGLEQRDDLKNIRNAYESKRRFILAKSGFKSEIISKSLMTREDVEKVRAFFAPKSHLFYRLLFPALPWAVGLMTGLTLWLLLAPVYFLQTTGGPMQAYWNDSELVVAIPKDYMGFKRRNLDEIFPSFQGRSGRPKAAFETRFVDVKNGVKTETTLTGTTPLFFREVGADLICVTGRKADRHGWKLADGAFVPLTPEELEASRSEGVTVDPAWGRFRLWDENDQEVEPEDPMGPTDDVATFRVQPRTLIVHHHREVKKESEELSESYSLEGVGPAGGEEDLGRTDSALKMVSFDEFQKRFPKGSGEEGEEAP